MKIYNADRTPLNIIRIITAVLTAVIIILCRILIPFFTLMIVLISVFSATGIILIFFYFPAMFRNLEFYVGENTVKKMHGVFFRREQTINISSVQYITTAVCGLEGFCFIILNVYGGIMILPFLSHKNFKAILHELEHDVIRR